MKSPILVCADGADCRPFCGLRFVEGKLYGLVSTVMALRLDAHDRVAHEIDRDDTHRYNEFGQPIGFALPDWKPPPFPPHAPLAGPLCPRSSRSKRARHARDIHEAQARIRRASRWTYSFSGPFADFAGLRAVDDRARRRRAIPQLYAIVDAASGRAVGTASYMRIEPRHGVIEMGNIYFSPRLARTRAATEAMYLFMANVFELGIPALRVEMRQLQSAVARRGDPFRVHVRRHVPPGHREQGPQSRHQLVLHHRRRLERRPEGRRTNAGSIPRNFDAAGAAENRGCRSSPRRSCTPISGRCDRPTSH